MQEVLSDERLKLVEPKSTRWLSHHGAVQAFLRCFGSVVRELEYEAETNHDVAAAAWAKKIKTYRFVAALHLLSDSDVLPILVRMSKHFQERYVDFSSLKTAVTIATTSLEQLFANPMAGCHLAKLDQAVTSLETKEATLVHTVGSADRERETFCCSIARPYIRSVLNALSHRLPDMAILDALSVFQPQFYPQDVGELAEFGNDKLATLLKEVGVDKLSCDGDVHRALVPEEETTEEWCHLKPVVANTPSLWKLQHASDFVAELHKCYASELPNILRLADWGLAIAVTSVECERDFSKMKLIKTARRNRLSNRNLEKLMRLSLDGRPVASFPYDRALLKWHAVGTRRAAPGPVVRSELCQEKLVERRSAVEQQRDRKERDGLIWEKEAERRKAAQEKSQKAEKKHKKEEERRKAAQEKSQKVEKQKEERRKAERENNQVEKEMPREKKRAAVGKPGKFGQQKLNFLRKEPSPDAAKASRCVACHLSDHRVLRVCGACSVRYHHMCQTSDEEGKLCNACHSTRHQQ